eukprot:c41096_g1_i1 orf=207-440(+)
MIIRIASLMVGITYLSVGDKVIKDSSVNFREELETLRLCSSLSREELHFVRGITDIHYFLSLVAYEELWADFDVLFN